MSIMTTFSLIIALAGCNDAGVTAFNASPVATITSHADEDEVCIGELTSFHGSASDPDDVNTSLLVTWYADEEQVCGPTAPDGIGFSSCTATVEASSTEIRMEVFDAQGAAASDSVLISPVTCGTTTTTTTTTPTTTTTTTTTSTCTTGDGTAPECAGLHCLEILDSGYSTGDGTYWLDPFWDESLVFEAYCDMTSDGGGWTYIARGSNDYTQTNSAFGTEQSDPTVSEQWHLSMDAINAIVDYSIQYQSYVTMGVNGDSDSTDADQFRVRKEYEAMTFESAMFDYEGWNGSSWVPATTSGETSHRGPSWIKDSSNLCCARDVGGDWSGCYVASESLGEGLWSQGNANQHLRCSAETEVQNGLLLFVRKGAI